MIESPVRSSVGLYKLKLNEYYGTVCFGYFILKFFSPELCLCYCVRVLTLVALTSVLCI